jgi:hypothetical protein
MLTFPSVEAMMIVFPEEDGPNSLERSTLIVRIFPSTVISTFFMVPSPLSSFFGPEYNGIGGVGQGRGLVVLGIEMFHGKGWGTGVPGAFGHSWPRLLPSALIPLFVFDDRVPKLRFLWEWRTRREAEKEPHQEQKLP